MVIYNRGSYISGFEFIDVVDKGSYFVINNNLADDIQLPSIDYSKYTTFNIIVSIPAYETSTARKPELTLTNLDGAGYEYRIYFSDFECTLEDAEFIIPFPIDDCTSNGQYGMSLRLMSSSSGTVSSEQSFYIYKIWLT